MTEGDVLKSEIDALKAVQREAWRDRREIRNRIRQSEVELRANLRLMSERLRYRPRPAEEVGDSLANINFRFFSGPII